MVRELLYRSAGELAGLVRSGAVSATELTEAALSAADGVGRQLGAFLHLDPDGAAAAAAAVHPGDPRPFAGVPTVIKDNRPVRGMPLTFGTGLLRDYRASHDAAVVARLRTAGFVLIGKTSLPEFGILPVSEPEAFGPARNPWDPEHTPGGSSGGSAAAVAAGVVPVAHGNDGAGSLRIPAACCGLLGLKPSRGRTSFAPELGESFFAVEGMLTRTVQDTAQLLDLLSGPEPGDASWAPPPAHPFASALGPPPPLRIGLTTSAPGELAEPDPVHRDAVRDAALLLADLGHRVEEVSLPWSPSGLVDLFTSAYAPAVALSVRFAALVAGRAPAAADVEPLSWAFWERAATMSAADHLMVMTQLQLVGRSIVNAMDHLDAVLTPTLAGRPVRVGQIDPTTADPMAAFAAASRFAPYPAVANVTGQPAVSVPYGLGPDGLPVSVHLLGRPTAEATLLSLAAQFEQARPWSQLRPPGLARQPV